MCYNLFIQLYSLGDVGSFQIWAVTNGVAVSILSAMKNVWVYLGVEGLGPRDAHVWH